MFKSIDLAYISGDLILDWFCVVLQGILINGQFPGPDIHSVTNDNLIINVFNSLDEPFLLSWLVTSYIYLSLCFFNRLSWNLLIYQLRFKFFVQWIAKIVML